MRHVVNRVVLRALATLVEDGVAVGDVKTLGSGSEGYVHAVVNVVDEERRVQATLSMPSLGKLGSSLESIWLGYILVSRIFVKRNLLLG